jgi:Terminase DNA packaging enzyme
MMTMQLPKQSSNSMINDTISDALGMSPIQQVLPKVNKEPIDTVTDYQYARGNMLNILEKGNEALDGMLDVAGQSQHPRAYEVVATLIKTLADTNKDLIELAKKTKELERLDGVEAPQTINNNLFVGSTTELQKLLKKSNEQE